MKKYADACCSLLYGKGANILSILQILSEFSGSAGLTPQELPGRSVMKTARIGFTGSNVGEGFIPSRTRARINRAPTIYQNRLRTGVTKIITLLVILLLAVSNAQARSLVLSGRAGAYEVEVVIDRNPPILGENGLEIAIKEANGRRVTEAQVLVNYYMPPMPRMAPMNYRVNAKLKSDTYRASMNLIMAGPWIIAVKISAGGKMTTAKFNIDVP
jgi:hypothetical protein